IITRHTPRFSRFPYTTLFRSNVKLRCRELSPMLANGPRKRSLNLPKLEFPFVAHEEVVMTRFPEAQASISALATAMIGGMRSTPDRKSTRLNSSHGSISYAVF